MAGSKVLCVHKDVERSLHYDELELIFSSSIEIDKLLFSSLAVKIMDANFKLQNR